MAISQLNRTAYLRILEIGGIALIYFSSARVSQWLAIPPGNVTPVWLPSGIMLAAVLLRGYYLWPGIWLGAFLGNTWAYGEWGTMASAAATLFAGAANGTGDVLGAAGAAYLIERYTKIRDPFERCNHIIQFLVFGVLAGPVASAIFGVTSLCLAGFVPWSVFGHTLLTWVVGDSMGVMVLTPAIMAWLGSGYQTPRFRNRIELLLFMTSLGAISLYSLEIYPLPGNIDINLFPFAPVLIWAALRLGRRMTYSAILLISTMAVIVTVSGHGHFTSPSLNHSLIAMQIFVALMAGTALVLTGVVADQNRTLETLRLAEETSRALLNASQDSAILLRRNGTIIGLNDRAASRLGGTAHGLVNRCIYDLLPPVYVRSRKIVVDEVVDTGKPVHFEDERNGRYFDHHVYPIRDTGDDVVQLAIYARDVTEYRNAQLELSESRNRLEQQVRDRTRQLLEINQQLQEENRRQGKLEQENQHLRRQIEFVLGTTRTGLDIIDADFNIHYIDLESTEFSPMISPLVF